MIVLALGVWDDLRSLKPSQKFLIQVFLATVAYMAGFRITNITHPLDPGAASLGFLSYPITVLWIVGVTNAINLIDGLDGLAGGVSTIAAITIFSISLLGQDVGSAMVALFLAGALVGFLPFNFNPARIFLGDSGSLFLGFSLAILSIQGGTRASTTFAIVVPILALGLPIMDTLLAMMRRFLSSLFSTSGTGSVHGRLHGMFLPDKGHIHHKLVAIGLSHKDAVLILYVISLAFGLCAFAVTMVNNTIAALILAVVALATIVGVRRLKYSEMSILKTGALLPLYSRPIIQTEVFTFFLDFGFVIISAAIALMLTSLFPLFDKHFFVVLTVLTASQFSILWIAKLHRRTFAHFGIGDGLAISRTIAFSVLTSAAVLYGLTFVYPGLHASVRLTPFLLDFYILLTLVLGSRLSLHALRYISHREATAGRKALIYGANANGMMILERFLATGGSGGVVPIGFVDNDPALEGKLLNGFPVFGGHWKIHGLVRKHKIDEIFLCADMGSELLKRLRKASQQYRLRLVRPQFLLEDITHSDTNYSIGLPEGSIPEQPKAEVGMSKASPNREQAGRTSSR